MARAILQGRKTQTRRPVKFVATQDRDFKPRKGRSVNYLAYDDPRPKAEVPCRYKPEHDYALQRGRGKPAAEGVRLLVVDVAQEKIGQISYDAARAEGFRDRDEFFAYWHELYGEDADLDQPVWVITFRPTTEDRYPTDNRDPRKGPLDHAATPPATGGMKKEPEEVPESFLQRDRLRREVDVADEQRRHRLRMMEERVAVEAKLAKSRQRPNTVRALDAKRERAERRLKAA